MSGSVGDSSPTKRITKEVPAKLKEHLTVEDQEVFISGDPDVRFHLFQKVVGAAAIMEKMGVGVQQALCQSSRVIDDLVVEESMCGPAAVGAAGPAAVDGAAAGPAAMDGVAATGAPPVVINRQRAYVIRGELEKGVTKQGATLSANARRAKEMQLAGYEARMDAGFATTNGNIAAFRMETSETLQIIRDETKKQFEQLGATLIEESAATRRQAVELATGSYELPETASAGDHIRLNMAGVRVMQNRVSKMREVAKAGAVPGASGSSSSDVWQPPLTPVLQALVAANPLQRDEDAKKNKEELKQQKEEAKQKRDEELNQKKAAAQLKKDDAKQKRDEELNQKKKAAQLKKDEAKQKKDPANALKVAKPAGLPPCRCACRLGRWTCCACRLGRWTC